MTGEPEVLCLGHHLVIGTDHLQVESRADPHGVLINQFLDDEGAAIATAFCISWVNCAISHN